MRKDFPELKDKLPAESVKGGEFPGEDKLFKIDNSQTTTATGIKWTPLEKTIVDTVKSLKPFLN